MRKARCLILGLMAFVLYMAFGCAVVPAKEATVSYSVHGQNYGWQAWKSDGKTAGTTGKALRVEGIKCKVTGVEGLGITYRGHVQNAGWEKEWKSNGQISGTTGKARRLEAIQVKLTGTNASKYDVYYCVHVQGYGWLGWAKNGNTAGTSDLSRRVEAVCVRLLKKGAASPKEMGIRTYSYVKGRPVSIPAEPKAPASVNADSTRNGIPVYSSEKQIFPAIYSLEKGGKNMVSFYSRLPVKDIHEIVWDYHCTYQLFSPGSLYPAYDYSGVQDGYRLYTIKAKDVLYGAKRHKLYKAMATEIVKASVRPEMNDRERIDAICKEIKKRLKYDANSSSPVFDVEYISQWRGACGQFSNLLWCACKIVNIPCESVLYSNSALNMIHAKNRVYLNGKWIYVEPQTGKYSDTPGETYNIWYATVDKDGRYERNGKNAAIYNAGSFMSHPVRGEWVEIHDRKFLHMPLYPRSPR